MDRVQRRRYIYGSTVRPGATVRPPSENEINEMIDLKDKQIEKIMSSLKGSKEVVEIYKERCKKMFEILKTCKDKIATQEVEIDKLRTEISIMKFVDRELPRTRPMEDEEILAELDRVGSMWEARQDLAELDREARQDLGRQSRRTRTHRKSSSRKSRKKMRQKGRRKT